MTVSGIQKTLSFDEAVYAESQNIRSCFTTQFISLHHDGILHIFSRHAQTRLSIRMQHSKFAFVAKVHCHTMFD